MQLSPAGDKFVWMGHAPANCVENYTGKIAERNGTEVEKELKYLLPQSKIKSVVDKDTRPRPNTCPTRHTLSKTPGGITFFSDDDTLSKRFQDVTNEETYRADLRKAMHKVLDRTDNFEWGVEDPIGNKLIVEHLNGNSFVTLAMEEDDPDNHMILCFNGKNKEFSIVSKDFEISHNAQTKKMFISDVNKNQIEMNEDGITLVAKDGEGELNISAVNADGTQEPMVLGSQLKALLDQLVSALTNWAPVPMDGGAALKLQLADFLIEYAQYATGAKSYITKKGAL